MTPEEYYRQLAEEAAEKWAAIAERIENDDPPTNHELAEFLFEYGLTSASDAALYIARRLAGEIPPPHGNRGRRRKQIPAAEGLKWLYRFDRDYLQTLKASDPKAYREKYGARAPYMVARANISSEFDLGEETVRKIVDSADSGG